MCFLFWRYLYLTVWIVDSLAQWGWLLTICKSKFSSPWDMASHPWDPVLTPECSLPSMMLFCYWEEMLSSCSLITNNCSLSAATFNSIKCPVLFCFPELVCFPEWGCCGGRWWCVCVCLLRARLSRVGLEPSTAASPVLGAQSCFHKHVGFGGSVLRMHG